MFVGFQLSIQIEAIKEKVCDIFMKGKKKMLLITYMLKESAHNTDDYKKFPKAFHQLVSPTLGDTTLKLKMQTDAMRKRSIFREGTQR